MTHSELQNISAHMAEPKNATGAGEYFGMGFCLLYSSSNHHAAAQRS